MDLLQCAPPQRPSRRRKTETFRQVRSEERDMRFEPMASSSSTMPQSVSRRISLPSGHLAMTPRSLSTGRDPRSEFRHYGSSLSINNTGNVASELATRTLRPPSPTVLRKISTMSNASTSSSASTFSRSSSRPPLPNVKIDLESPRLASYLERPRLVSTLQYVKDRPASSSSSSSSSSAMKHSQPHHANSPSRDVSQYRNLRLGNFMEEPEAEDDVIPERLRKYYLETFLNVCSTCESLTHCDPTSPLHRGM